MAAFQGPWIVPAPCNSSDQCNDFLSDLYPDIKVGETGCYAELKAENDTINFGGCACSGLWGLGGPTCAEQTTATPSSIAQMSISVAVACLTILRFLPVLIGLMIKRGVFKINAAGTTYTFAWIGLLASFVDGVGTLAKVFGYNKLADGVTDAAADTAVIFLTVSVLNLVAAFVEMSSSVRLIHNIDKLRIPVIITVFAVACLVIFTYFFADEIVSTIIAYVVVLILTHLGIYGPIIMYVRSSRQMANTMNVTPPTKWQLFRAVFGDIFLGNRMMKRVLGFTHSSSSGVSRDSKLSKEEDHISGHYGARVASQSTVDTLEKSPEKSKDNAHHHRSQRPSHNREAKMIEFLSRAVRMGYWLSTSLCWYLIGASFAFAITYDSHQTYRLNVLAELIQDISVTSAFYQMLWFTELGYRKALTKMTHLMSQHRSESKDPALSKVDSKLDMVEELRGQKSTNNSSREEIAVVPTATSPPSTQTTLAIHATAD